MSTALDDLCDAMRPQVYLFLARLAEARVPVAIITTARSEAQHQLDLAAGRSAATHSKHVPATNATCPECRGTKSHALDVAPWETYQAHGPDKINWDAGGPENVKPPWDVIGRIATQLGLRWGGVWRTPFDPGHVELPG